MTIAADAQVRLFELRVRHPISGEEPKIPVTLARWLPSGRLTPLGDYYEMGGPIRGPLALSGRFVACVLEAEERYAFGPANEEVEVLNVQTGRRRVASPSRVASPCYLVAGDICEIYSGGWAVLTDIVVATSGTAAWIAEVCPEGGGSTKHPCFYEVLELSARSAKPVRVAASPAIDPKSLAEIPGHLYWTEAGQAREVEVK